MFHIGRRTSSLIERLAPRLPAGKPPRNQPSREELEREAEAEIQARIDLGRPGPEEAERTRPYPDWLMLRRPPMRSFDLVEVNLEALAPPARMPEAPAPPSRGPGQPAGAESARRSGAGSAG